MKRLYLLILLCFMIHINAQSQSGAFILSKYNTSTISSGAFWNETSFPVPANGKAFSYRLSDTVSTDWNALILSVFKFSPSNYYPEVIDSIQTIQEFTNDDSLNNTFNAYYLINPNQAFKQLNPIKSYSFQLNQITDTAFTTFTPKTGAVSAADTEICFFIIPGSGDNQTSAIVRGEGYHNMNCNVMTTLKKHGDIYVFTKPNEDFRAIRIKQLPTKKMVTDLYPTDSYLNQYLISNYKHEGINYLIECVAALKQLKKKYKKVFLLGCSQGGYAALYAALETEVDGVLISSGYSIKLDDNYLQFGNMAQKFAQLPFQLLKDSIRTKIRQQKSCYYFSWPPNDSPIYQAENLLHHTENYFNQGSPLTNVKYLYSYTNHAFPPCIYIDSFVNEVKDKPKAFVTDTLNICLYDSMIRKVEFLGQPPFTYSLFKNDTLVGSYTSLTKTDTITLFEEGNYQIRNITSATSLNGIWSDHFSYRKTPHAGFQIASSTYLCDSSKRVINFSFQGSAPFYLSCYTRDTNNVLQLESVDTFSTSNASIIKTNNQYFFEFNDAIACENFQDSILINDTSLQYQFSNEQYNCSSHKSDFNFELKGHSPFTIHYLKNGIPYTQIESGQNIHWELENGNYIITDITDATNCDTIINQAFIIAYDSISVIENPPLYNCNNDNFALEFHATGNEPFELMYLNDTSNLSITFQTADTTFYVSHTNYQPIQLTDATGCLIQFSSTSYSLNTDTLEFNFTNPVYDCDSSKTKIHFELEGNPPFTIYYKENSINKTITTSVGVFDKWFTNGNYFFEKVIDATGCSKDTNQLYVFNTIPLNASINQQHWNCDSFKYEIDFQLQGSAPWTISYHDLSSNHQVTTTDSLYKLFVSNGTWTIDTIKDANACQFILTSSTFTVNHNLLSASILPAIYDCDSNKANIKLQFTGGPPYTVHYYEDYIPHQFIATTDTSNWTIPNGTYLIDQITDNSGCTIDTSIGFVLNYLPLNASITNQFYNCDSQKYEIDFYVDGNLPWTLFYSDLFGSYSTTFSTSSASFMLGNGNWIINSIVDANGCVHIFNTNFLVSIQPLQATLSTPEFNCVTGMTHLTFEASGNPPYTVYYLQDYVLHQFISTVDSFDLIVPNGNYQIQKISDNNGCEIDTNLTYSFNYQILNAAIISQQYNCDSTLYDIGFLFSGNPPYQIHYTDGVSNFTTNTFLSSYHLMLPNGNWTIQYISDASNCIKPINSSYNLNYSALQATLISQVYDCDSLKLKVQFNLSGNAPWIIHSIINSPTPIHKYDTTSNPNFAKYLSVGNYSFQEISDANGCVQWILQNAINNYDTLSAHVNSQTYNCDSNKLQLNFNLTGVSPWILTYINITNGNVATVSSNNSSLTLLVPNGDYAFQAISDAVCSRLIFDTVHSHITAFSSSISNIKINCDSSKYTIDFISNGGVKPYHYNYYKDGQLFVLNSNSDTTNLILPNGNYYFEKAYDSLGCEIVYNNFQVANYNSFNWNNITSTYLCDKNLTALNIDVTHSNPVWLVYTNTSNNEDTIRLDSNHILEVGNGNYEFTMLYDSLGCKDTFHHNLIVNNEPLELDSINIIKDCENRNYQIAFSLEGKAPWYLFYNYNNIQDTLNIIDSNFVWHTIPGTYYWIELRDQNNCSLSILKSDTLVDFLTINPTLTLNGIQLIATSGASQYVWYKNDQVIDTTSNNTINFNGDGEYYAVLFDKENCSYPTNKISVSTPGGISLFPNPVYQTSHLIINDDFGTYWDYKLMDMRGQVIEQGTISEASKDFDLSHLESGIYNLRIIYESDFTKHLIRITKY